MKLAKIFSRKSTVFFAVFFSFFASQTFAVTHIINFGGGLGTVFSPATLDVNVGDTIIWQGFFGTADPFHELQSVTVPPNAQPFGPINTGMSFTYPVLVAGAYHYQCNVHASMGMVGDFTAGTAGVQNIVSNALATLEKSFPNPANGHATIRYSLVNASVVSLKIYDSNGKEVKQLVGEFQNAGSHETVFDCSALASGTYTYQLKTGDAMLSQQMVLVKE